MAELTIKIPDGLHEDTADLVARFATALAEKLHAAEKKYGYSNFWKEPNWEGDCVSALAEHLWKGDPRDVANYCAFMWHHKWSTQEAVFLCADKVTEIHRLPAFTKTDFGEQTMKVKCEECGWVGDTAEQLEAPHPFQEGFSCYGCPKCREVDSCRPCCDEPGCVELVSCGTPTPNGYRSTCGKHRPNTTPNGPHEGRVAGLPAERPFDAVVGRR